MKLPNMKEQAFVREYLKDFSGGKAAIRAGYSARTARTAACCMLKKPHIKAFLNSILQASTSTIQLTAQRVIDEISKIAFHDISVYFERLQNGVLVLKRIEDLTADQRAALAEYGDGKIRLYDKLAALEKLGKHLKLFTELHETTHTFTQMGRVVVNGKEAIFEVGSPKPLRP